jgi:enamine deaminase RidA (YjgF/YER057c/UK114 family)
MGRIAQRLAELGLALPPALKPPPGIVLPFEMVRVLGDRAIVAGHGPQAPDGAIAQPLGKVGSDVTEAEAYQAARLTALAVLGSLERALGDLDRIRAWVRVFGMVNSAPGFQRQPAVINGFSDLVLEVFGPDVGRHARSAVGLYELPFNIPVEVEAEVLVAA